MKADEKTINKQIDFIYELVLRLKCDMHAKYPKYSRARDDIKRIRHELNELSKMTTWDWSDKK